MILIARHNNEHNNRVTKSHHVSHSCISPVHIERNENSGSMSFTVDMYRSVFNKTSGWI